AWTDARADVRMTMPVHLASGQTHEPAELWVLRNRPIEQLADLLRGADDTLLGNLLIAEGETQGQRIVVLKAKPGRQRAPVLLLDAEESRPYLKLAHLYLPRGRRLQPGLRRDAVRELLAADNERITWLAWREDGSFVRESLAEAAFVPLLQRVQYTH